MFYKVQIKVYMPVWSIMMSYALVYSIHIVHCQSVTLEFACSIVHLRSFGSAKRARLQARWAIL